MKGIGSLMVALALPVLAVGQNRRQERMARLDRLRGLGAERLQVVPGQQTADLAVATRYRYAQWDAAVGAWSRDSLRFERPVAVAGASRQSVIYRYSVADSVDLQVAYADAAGADTLVQSFSRMNGRWALYRRFRIRKDAAGQPLSQEQMDFNPATGQEGSGSRVEMGYNGDGQLVRSAAYVRQAGRWLGDVLTEYHYPGVGLGFDTVVASIGDVNGVFNPVARYRYRWQDFAAGQDSLIEKDLAWGTDWVLDTRQRTRYEGAVSWMVLETLVGTRLVLTSQVVNVRTPAEWRQTFMNYDTLAGRWDSSLRSVERYDAEGLSVGVEHAIWANGWQLESASRVDRTYGSGRVLRQINYVLDTATAVYVPQIKVDYVDFVTEAASEAPDAVMAYPVPAREHVRIAGRGEAPSVVWLTDLSGRTVAEGMSVGDGVAVDLRGLAPGMYLAWARVGGREVAVRVVKE